MCVHAYVFIDPNIILPAYPDCGFRGMFLFLENHSFSFEDTHKHSTDSIKRSLRSSHGQTALSLVSLLCRRQRSLLQDRKHYTVASCCQVSLTQGNFPCSIVKCELTPVDCCCPYDRLLPDYSHLLSHCTILT